jgi:hypothetical protein
VRRQNHAFLEQVEKVLVNKGGEEPTAHHSRFGFKRSPTNQRSECSTGRVSNPLVLLLGSGSPLEALQLPCQSCKEFDHQRQIKHNISPKRASVKH